MFSKSDQDGFGTPLVVRGESLERTCRHCGSTSLILDWAQGDRICTKCGVVDEERLCDTRPEWREFNDADDLAKGAPASARCGMVAVDESCYLGGLQPTSLSRNVFGAPTKHSNSMRKRLITANRKQDRRMEILHNKALQNARLAHKIRKKNLNRNETESDLDFADCQDVRPEYDQLIIQEEEDIHRAQTALNADKWSLQRAIFLYGSGEESIAQDPKGGEGREELLRRLDNTLRKAAADLYAAYSMLQKAARKLQLPDRVSTEATSMLCQYAARRDGMNVKGVSSRLACRNKSAKATEVSSKRNEALERLREHNKTKQMGSLCAALLFLTARNLGWTRTFSEVCGSIQPDFTYNRSHSNVGSFIKAKHCSRAIDEIKTTFPRHPVTCASVESKRSVSDDVATSNFVDHSLRKLRLPPVAEASVRTLVSHCRNEQIETGIGSGIKLSTMCASLAYFVCVMGAIMQRLAAQAQTKDPRASGSSFAARLKRKATTQNGISRNGSSVNYSMKKKKTIHGANNSTDELVKILMEESDSSSDEGEPFDVFSNSVGVDISCERREYEMRRVWDAWAEQMPWFRSLGDLEQSCGVSGKVLLDYYKSSLFPRRQSLLQLLRDAVVDEDRQTKTNAAVDAKILVETPLASTLLCEVCVAGSVMHKGAIKAGDIV